MTSDYAEATPWSPRLVKALRSEAQNVVLDFLTPSDVSYRDMEQGKVDLAINRFNEIPQTSRFWYGATVLACILNANTLL